jgi:hypothetical protein
MELHESGEAAPSLTLLDGVPTIRAAIFNHRTREEDMDAFMDMLERVARRARAEPPPLPSPREEGEPLSQD